MCRFTISSKSALNITIMLTKSYFFGSLFGLGGGGVVTRRQTHILDFSMMALYLSREFHYYYVLTEEDFVIASPEILPCYRKN